MPLNGQTVRAMLINVPVYTVFLLGSGSVQYAIPLFCCWLTFQPIKVANSYFAHKKLHKIIILFLCYLVAYFLCIFVSVTVDVYG